jgi:hypothetical protein
MNLSDVDLKNFRRQFMDKTSNLLNIPAAQTISAQTAQNKKKTEMSWYQRPRVA